MSQESFVKTEREIGEWWKQELEGSVKATDSEEEKAGWQLQLEETFHEDELAANWLLVKTITQTLLQ